MKHNLVWTFWFALILAIIGTFICSAILVKQWTKFVSYSQMEEQSSFPLIQLSKQVKTALFNKKSNLEELLLEHPLNKYGQIYLINSSGSDVLSRPLPAKVLANLKAKSPQKSLFTRKIISDRGELFYLIFKSDSPALVMKIFRKFGLYWILFAALIISGLISWWLATKIVRPIEQIASASDRQGKGDFTSKIDKNIYLRRDEIGGLARQLQLSGIKIRDLIRKQKDLLRDVSHEVRTPLARLQIAAETLELDSSDEIALRQIKEEVLTIDQLVQDLLHLSHFDRPSQNHKIECIPISILVNQCIERSKMLAARKNVLITAQDKDQRNINVTGVKFLLERALDNLISNAIRHSPEDGEIQVSYEIDNGRCCVGVWDQGEGVSDESLEEIFEPFIRLDSSRNRQTGGFGLGLSLVRRIAKLHEGLVTASNCSTGFVVKLIIPINKNT